MTIENQIKAAIDRSISHNEIVHITIEGDSGDALTAIKAIAECETDYTMIDREGLDTLDVWGFDPDAPEGEMIWRLAVHFEAVLLPHEIREKIESMLGGVASDFWDNTSEQNDFIVLAQREGVDAAVQAIEDCAND